jgi:glycosyltransferase involved in cell wall biosynthesis
VARNAITYVSRTLDSLLLQSFSPQRIIVVDDGSEDGTQRILNQYRRRYPRALEVLTLPDRGYDIRRVQHNINLAWAEASRSNIKTDFFMITGDDCSYPHNYAEVLVSRMSVDAKIAIASGRVSGHLRDSSDQLPSGSGRMIKCGFWKEIGGMYPIRAGGETWLVYKAMELGLKACVFEDLAFEHRRPLGSEHQFADWGASMYNLGYHPLFVIGRLAKNLLERNVGVEGSVNMIRGYMQGALGSSDFYFGRFEDSLRKFIGGEQQKRIARAIASRLKIPD